MIVGILCAVAAGLCIWYLVDNTKTAAIAVAGLALAGALVMTVFGVR